MGKSFINLRPLIDSKTGIFCHILEIDNTKIIVDCGISESFDYSVYDTIAKTINECDCILLTSFGIAHMGAVGLFPDVPVYCSIPTAVLGRIVLDDFQLRLGEKVRNLFSPRQIKFSQPFKVNDVEISSFNAGYIVGNSTFKITKDLQTIAICYNLNHRKENFLDGFNSGSIENSSIFITNSAYARILPYTIKSRDENLLKRIKEVPGKAILSVSYSRLLELLCILHREKVMIVSMHGKLFIERAKAMIEWAGSKAIDFLGSMNIEFGRISDINNRKIIIVLNESHASGYLGTILDRLNSPDNCLFIFDRNEESFHPESLIIYDFSYSQKKIEPAKQQVDVQEENDSSDGPEAEHWSYAKKTVFLRDGYNKGYVFPPIKKRKQNSQYGEVVRFGFEKKVSDNALKDVQSENIEVLETATYIKTGVDPLLSIQHLDLLGISDPASFKTVAESINPDKIVIVDDCEDGALYLVTSFNLSKAKTESLVCNSVLSLGYVNAITKVLISEKLVELEFIKLLNKRVSKFLAVRQDNFVDLAGNYDRFTIGSIESANIKRALIENGFQVESFDLSLLVNNNLKILFDGNDLTIESMDDRLLIGVREILYQFIAII